MNSDQNSDIRWPDAFRPLPGAPSRRVLMLAYFFPPSTRIGARRPEGLSRWLPEFGWEPTVITAEAGEEQPGVIRLPDASWTRRLQRAVHARQPMSQVTRGSQQPASLRRAMKHWLREGMHWLDLHTGWSHEVVARAIAEGRRQPVDLVWATCDPFALAPAAVAVARALGVPCVVDLRDPPPPYVQPQDAGHWLFSALRQVDVLSVAVPACVMNALPAIRKGQSIYPVLSGNWHTSVTPSRPSPYFSILQATMPAFCWRDPRPLYRALARLAEEIPTFRADARLRLIGPEAPLLAQEDGYAAIADMCELLPVMPYAQVVELMAESSVLLIIKSDSPDGPPDALPGKFFDYLAFQTPVLCFGGIRGLIGELLAWTGAGAWAPDETAIADFLRDQYLTWKRDGIVHAPRHADPGAYFTHRRMAAECAELFSAAVEHRPVRCREELPWKVRG